jgi:hypothetical protein
MSKLIEFFCDDKNLVEHFPPVPAKSMVPDWYKKMPLYVNDKMLDAKEMAERKLPHVPETIKACVPVADYITSGYVLRYPADIMVTPDVDDNGFNTWWWKSDYVSCGGHPFEQCPIEVDGKRYNYFKVEHPWCIKTPPGYSCYFYQPEYFFDSRIRYFPAIVDTDEYHSPVLFVGTVRAEKTFILKAGSPMVIVFPFKRDTWESKVFYKERERRLSVRMLLTRGYKKLIHKKKEYF